MRRFLTIRARERAREAFEARANASNCDDSIEVNAEIAQSDARAAPMAVLLETSKGDIVIDLFVDDAPKTCLNFVKLCKMKYYNHCKFFDIQKDFMAQTGDPTNTGRGGD